MERKTLEEYKAWFVSVKDSLYKSFGKDIVDNHINDLVKHLDIPIDQAKEVFGNIIK